MERGRIKTLNRERGYGFIRRNGTDYFLHRSGMAGRADEFDDLQEGDEVEFEVQDGPKGQRAVEVRVA